MNNRIEIEMSQIDSSFEHNYKYLEDAQNRKGPQVGLPKRLAGGRNYKHINPRYLDF